MKSKKGITLIALIITIVVLLILAGVSINAIVGENGVLKQAQNASKKTNEAKDEEQRKMTIAEAAMNFENTEYKDKNGEKVTIPEGFAVSEVEGENTVEDGLVIIDSNGNEFVWIPCEKENVSKYTTACKLSENWTSVAYTSDYSGSDTDVSRKGKSGWKNPEAQIKAGENSIEKYGGFYIARYEAGVPSNASFYVPSDESGNNVPYQKNNVKNVNNVIPVSKRKNQVWNYISQENAKIVSEEMYKNNNSISSYLIDTNAWNYICVYILKEKKNIDFFNSTNYGNYYDHKNYSGLVGLYALYDHNIYGQVTNYNYGKIDDVAPKGKGNYRLELATGLCEDFKTYNIYDMAGNLWEWTTEETLADGYRPGNKEEIIQRKYAVVRGGCFDATGFNYPLIIYNGCSLADETDFSVGYRVVLYLK